MFDFCSLENKVSRQIYVSARPHRKKKMEALGTRLDRIEEIYGVDARKYFETHPVELRFFVRDKLGCLDENCQEIGCGNRGCNKHHIVSFCGEGCPYCEGTPIKNDLWIPTIDKRPTLCNTCFKAICNFNASCPECKGGGIFKTLRVFRKACCYWCSERFIRSDNDHICKCK